MRVAFYAPMKAPDHPVPSGDRRIANLLLAALRLAGHEPIVASGFRSREPLGSVSRQAKLAEMGGKLAARLVRQWKGPPPRAWLTYHLYYKAPDWIGPLATKAWGIPYIVVEASYAPKRALGPWGMSHQAVAEAVREAAAVVCLNPNDNACLASLADERLYNLSPFLNAQLFENAKCSRQLLAREHRLDVSVPWLLTVGMMRYGDKLASYQMLAQVLAQLSDRPWRLLVVGDGAAAAEVRKLFAPLADRVAWLGALEAADLAQVYRSCDLLVWPAIREAIGMALLEAQASGLAVVAGRTGGVPAVVRHGETGLLPAVGNVAAFADSVRSLLDDSYRREAMGQAAKLQVMTHHSIEAASGTLDRILWKVVCRT